MANKKRDNQATAVISVQGLEPFEVPKGSNLRETLRREGVYLDGTCSDRGTCGRCVVKIRGGDAGEPSVSETGLLGERSPDHQNRLACRVTVNGDLDISIDSERMLEIDRTGRWKEVWGSPLWHPEKLTKDRSGYGVAVDVGSTSVAVGLFDLEEARPLDLKAAANPQIPWGEDIISRLGSADADPDTAAALRESVWKAVSDLVRSLCMRNGVSGGRITRVVVVGNSAMHHIALGMPVGSLLKPPYSPSESFPSVLTARDLPGNMQLDREAQICFPPLAGGYAGSDALASLLAARSLGARAGDKGVRAGALIDVGTNTEIAAWKGDSIVVATAPSGPAFEGGHISSGMRAEEGAVFSAHIADGELVSEVLGGGPARGICGTGIVDIIASMLDCGILDRTGLMAEGSHPLVNDGKFVVSRENGITLTGGDVAEIQKAKSAIAATFAIVLQETGLEPPDLECVYLAGAFGSRLKLASAFKTGLLPELPPDRYVLAGNAALVGASMILVSGKEQVEMERLWRLVKHHSAAEDKRFEELFIDNLYFGPE